MISLLNPGSLRPSRRLLVLLPLLAIFSACKTSALRPPEDRTPVPLAAPQTPEARAISEAYGKKYIISTQGTATTRAAKEILDQGGNIIDAAVAASFTIAVERPHSTGVGGGGFLLYREARTGKTYAIDFRERAPRRVKPDLFLDAQGNPVPARSETGILSVATPGLVAGLTTLQSRFGTLPLPRVMAPAIDLATHGFAVYPDLADALQDRQGELAKYPASRAIFLKPDGNPYRRGERLVQRDLADTLRLIARDGAPAFYTGSIGKKIVTESQRRQGLLSARDLREYPVRWREPLHGNFHGKEIISMPPPSSGGALVIEILQMLERDHLRAAGMLSASAVHLEAGAMQLAFADRAAYFGDPGFVKMPTDILTSPAYALRQRARIDPDHARPAAEVTAGDVSPPPGTAPSGRTGAAEPRAENPQTTHFSIMDDAGNVVVSTQTINGWMGSAVVVPGTGILLNDEMDDFSAKKGASNMFGAVGSDANLPGPGKTPLSSMAPTIVLDQGKPILALGAPGGTRIITCVAQTILNYLEFGLPLYESVAAVRIHEQWKPDELYIEPPGIAPGAMSSLSQMGHTVRVTPSEVSCRVMAVSREGDQLHGVSDPRDAGSAAGG